MADGGRFTPHDVAERARLISHGLYAEQLDAAPALVDDAREFLKRGIAANGGTMGQRAWLALLERPWDEVRATMLRDDHEGRLLRSSSPFSHLVGVRDERARRGIWRLAKAELSNPTP